jgi:serine/threonine-protein kinase
MAPEQLAGETIGPRTDLWGLGAVLWQMLSGRAPFAAASAVTLAEAQRAGPGPLPETDPGLARIATACLAIDPAARPRHAGTVAAALRAWLAGDPVPEALLDAGALVDPEAVTASLPVVAPPPAAAVAQPTVAPAATTRRPRDPVWWPLLVLAGAAAVAVVILAVNGLPGAASSSATASPSARATALATPSASPTTDIRSLPKPIRDQVIAYRQACGADAPLPPDLASMNKKQADAYFGPRIKSCGGGD